MPFTLVVLLLVFIFPVLTCIVLFKSHKKIALSALSIPIVAVAAAAGWWIYEVNYQFAGSTPLSGESIGELTLFSQLDEAFKDEHGFYEEYDNVYHHESFRFAQFDVGTNEKDDIIYIRTIDSSMSTGYNLSVGTPLDEVVEAYGERYYSRSDMGNDTIGYIDRDEDITLEFDHRDGEVTGIRLNYEQ